MERKIAVRVEHQPRRQAGGGTGDGPVAAGGRQRLEPGDGAVAVEALGGDGGAGGVMATGPDPLPAAAGRPGAWRHTASSTLRTFFAFLSACRPRSRWRPWSRHPRPGAGPRPCPRPVFARDAARPRPDLRLLRTVAGAMVVVGRDEAPQGPEVVGQTAFRQPFRGIPRLGGRAGRGSRRTGGSGSWWYDPRVRCLDCGP